MSSPFANIEEFNSALDGPTGGAIYTFAQSPAINIIALLVAVGIFIWFIISTYRSHAEPHSGVDKSLNHLSSFMVIGLLSFVAASHRNFERLSTVEQTARHTPSQTNTFQQASNRIPLGLIGMVSTGLPMFSRMSKRKKSRRSLRSSGGYKYRR